MQYLRQLMIAPQCKFVEGCFKCFKRLKISGIFSMTLHTSQHTSRSWTDQNYVFVWSKRIFTNRLILLTIDIIMKPKNKISQLRFVAHWRPLELLSSTFQTRERRLPLKFWHLATRLWSIPSSQPMENYLGNLSQHLMQSRKFTNPVYFPNCWKMLCQAPKSGIYRLLELKVPNLLAKSDGNDWLDVCIIKLLIFTPDRRRFLSEQTETNFINFLVAISWATYFTPQLLQSRLRHCFCWKS